MASVTEQKGQSGGDHRGDGQREQDDSVQEHRGTNCFTKHTNMNTVHFTETIYIIYYSECELISS